MTRGERKTLKLSVWTVLTVFVVVVLINGNGNTVSVVCGAIVIATGVLTTALILSGRDPWRTETRKARKRNADLQLDAFKVKEEE